MKQVCMAPALRPVPLFDDLVPLCVIVRLTGARHDHSNSPSMAERQTKAVSFLSECSSWAFHSSYNFLDWRFASRVRLQLSNVLL